MHDDSTIPVERKLESRVSSLETAVSNLAGEVGSIHRILEEMRSQQLTAQKTQWGPILSSLGLIITVVGLFLASYGQNQNRIESSLVKLTDTFIDHAQTDGHPAMIQRVTAVEHAHQHLDQVLQREMRLLDADSKTQIAELDRRLQQEMRLLNDSIKVRVETLDRSVTGLQEWQTSHDQRVVGTNADQSARIKALEEWVFWRAGGLE